MSAGALGQLQRASEGRWFNTEERLAVVRRLERLVEQGKLDKSALEAVHRFESPTEIIRKRDVSVFEYKKGLLPPPKPMPSFSLGTQFSLGRSRWTTDDASIFSVADGKRLASTPPPNASHYENLRMAKIQKAALQTPTVAGYRVLPEMTPGRAMLWGSILAIWGTAALVSAAARSLDIRGAEDAPAKLKAVFDPVAQFLKSNLAPLKGSMSVAAATHGEDIRAETAQSVFVQGLKDRLMAH